MLPPEGWSNDYQEQPIVPFLLPAPEVFTFDVLGVAQTAMVAEFVARIMGEVGAALSGGWSAAVGATPPKPVLNLQLIVSGVYSVLLVDRTELPIPASLWPECVVVDSQGDWSACP